MRPRVLSIFWTNKDVLVKGPAPACDRRRRFPEAHSCQKGLAARLSPRDLDEENFEEEESVKRKWSQNAGSYDFRLCL
jgi:hypothetical protein